MYLRLTCAGAPGVPPKFRITGGSEMVVIDPSSRYVIFHITCS